MGQIKINKGIDLPIKGSPIQEISEAPSVHRVALVADDYQFMKPKFAVKVGDEVKRGQALFEDRKNPGVIFTAPGAGKISAINRGAQRRLVSVVIDLNEREQAGKTDDSDYQEFTTYSKDAVNFDAEKLRALLIESGLWTVLRQRPFNKVPDADGQCAALFVTVTDSNPLAPSVKVVLSEGDKLDDFKVGLKALSKLTSGKTFVCQGEELGLESAVEEAKAQLETFTGVHPAGLVGTHIHYLHPVTRERVVWHVGYQDVISVGRFLKTGKIDVERVISVAGPATLEGKAGLLRTRIGADIAPLVTNKLCDAEYRVVEGSVFYGRTVSNNWDEDGYLGRYRQQISCVREDRERVFFGWLAPGGEKFSVSRAFFSHLMAGQYGSKRLFNFTTTTHGSHRAMVPIGQFERVMPLDMMPTFLLRALLKDDLERAEALGCLELDEEDLSLCTFVSPGKEDYGPALRRTLTTIWKEG